jgi:endonuclease IV
LSSALSADINADSRKHIQWLMNVNSQLDGKRTTSHPGFPTSISRSES